MSRETHSEILVVALVLSAGLHFGTMYYARPKVMTHVVKDATRSQRREAMTVTKALPPPEGIPADVLRDIDALREAPSAEEVAEPPLAPIDDPDTAGTRTVAPAALAEVPNLPNPRLAQPKFDLKPLSSARSAVELPLPTPQVVTRPKPPRLVAAPTERPPAPVAAAAVAPLVPRVETPVNLGLERIESVSGDLAKVMDNKDAFRPEQEFREKVDEKLVAQEKQAVRDLLDISRAEELATFVDVSLTRATQGEWTYFKVRFTPRATLPVVPKDVVILLDASGSIGKDRIRSIRDSAKGFLRTCTNTGDRFNLVAFRDKYTYAFRRWQECSQSSFDAADKWLGNVTAHGRTDVFATIRSVLTLPRDPARPLIALVITDGDANSGVSATSQILSQFTALNDGLVSVYMYGVKGTANRALIDVLTRGNRGESLVYDGWRWSAGSGIEGLGERFRDPVLSDLRIVFATDTKAEFYPRMLKNLYRGEALDIVGRVPASATDVAFSVKGLNAKDPYEGYFRLKFATAKVDASVAEAWSAERQIDAKLR